MVKSYVCVSLEQTQMDSATNERINEVHFKSDCRLSFADMSIVACKNIVNGYNTINWNGMSHVESCL